MKPETEIRNLKAELRRTQKALEYKSNQALNDIGALQREVHALQRECDHLGRDNVRLGEIAALARELAEARK